MPTIKFSPLPCPFCGCKPKIRQVNAAPAGVGSALAVTIACESKKCAINPSLQVYTTSLSDEKRKLLRKEAMKKWNVRKNYSLQQVINYIENEAEILIPAEELMHKSGRHLTKKEYGIVLLKHLTTELREKFLKQN